MPPPLEPIPSLLQALEAVPDHRRAAGHRHALPVILALVCSSCACSAATAGCWRWPSGAERTRPGVATGYQCDRCGRKSVNPDFLSVAILFFGLVALSVMRAWKADGRLAGCNRWPLVTRFAVAITTHHCWSTG